MIEVEITKDMVQEALDRAALVPILRNSDTNGHGQKIAALSDLMVQKTWGGRILSDKSYDFDWTWKDANGNDLEEPNKQCPYCESPIELTEVGIAKEKEDADALRSKMKALAIPAQTKDTAESEHAEYKKLPDQPWNICSTQNSGTAITVRKP